MTLTTITNTMHAATAPAQTLVTAADKENAPVAALNTQVKTKDSPTKPKETLRERLCKEYNFDSLKDDFKKDGYLHIKNFYKGEELKQLISTVDRLQSKKEEVGGQMMWFEKSSKDGSRILNRVEDYCRRDSESNVMFKAAETSSLMQFCNVLLEDQMVLFKDKINFKLPGGDGFKAHQDQAAGWGKYIDWFISIGVFVDHSTIANGCLEVSPGLHTKGLLGKEWEPIENLDIDYQYVECGPGDILLFDSFVPHRSAGNTTDTPRRALFLTYNSAKDGDKLDWYYADKRKAFPPDIERPQGKEYVYRV